MALWSNVSFFPTRSANCCDTWGPCLLWASGVWSGGNDGVTTWDGGEALNEVELRRSLAPCLGRTEGPAVGGCRVRPGGGTSLSGHVAPCGRVPDWKEAQGAWAAPRLNNKQ